MSSVAEKPRSVIGTFFKDAHGRLTLDSLTVVDANGGVDFYDVDYSRRYGYIFHLSGMTGSREAVPVSGIYAVSGDVDVVESESALAHPAARRRNQTRRLRRLPTSFDMADECDLLDWLQREAIEDDAVWCAKCRDWLPGRAMCEHTWWCDRTGSYSTPGDRCACENREECRD